MYCTANKNHNNAPNSSINNSQVHDKLALRREKSALPKLSTLARTIGIAAIGISSIYAQGREVFVPVIQQSGISEVDVVIDGTKTSNPLSIPVSTNAGGTITDITSDSNYIYMGVKNMTPEPNGTTSAVFNFVPTSPFSFQKGWGVFTPAEKIAITPDAYLCTGTTITGVNSAEISTNSNEATDITSVIDLANSNSGAIPLLAGISAIGTSPGYCWYLYDVNSGITAPPGIGITVLNIRTGQQYPIPISTANMAINPAGTEAYLSTIGSLTVISTSMTQPTLFQPVIQANNPILLPGNANAYAGNVVFVSDGYAYVGTAGAAASSTAQNTTESRRPPLQNLPIRTVEEGYISKINPATGVIELKIPIKSDSANPPMLFVSPNGSELAAIGTYGSNVVVNIMKIASGAPLTLLTSLPKSITLTEVKSGISLTAVPLVYSKDGTMRYYAYGNELYTINQNLDVVSTPLDGNAIGPIAAVTLTTSTLSQAIITELTNLVVAQGGSSTTISSFVNGTRTDGLNLGSTVADLELISDPSTVLVNLLNQYSIPLSDTLEQAFIALYNATQQAQ